MTGFIESPIRCPHIKAVAQIRCDLCRGKLQDGPYMLVVQENGAGKREDCYFHGVYAPKLQETTR